MDLYLHLHLIVFGVFFSSNLNENLSVVIDMEKDSKCILCLVSDTSEIPSFETGNFKFFSFFLLYLTYFLQKFVQLYKNISLIFSNGALFSYTDNFLKILFWHLERSYE